MNTVTLAKALKIKTRLAADLNTLQKAIREKNARRLDRVTPESGPDAATLLERYHAVQATMIEVKTKIAAANAGILGDMETMNQLKAEITLLEAMECRDEVEVVAYGKEVREYTWRSAIPEVRRDELVRALQKRIDAHQDRIDEYNAATRVTLSVD